MSAKGKQNQTKQKQISAEFAVLCAVGSRKNRVAGGVPIQIFPNTFTRRAARVGTLLKHAGVAPSARINGVGQPACAAAKIPCTKIGMRKSNSKFQIEPLDLNFRIWNLEFGVQQL